MNRCAQLGIVDCGFPRLYLSSPSYQPTWTWLNTYSWWCIPEGYSIRSVARKWTIRGVSMAQNVYPQLRPFKQSSPPLLVTPSHPTVFNRDVVPHSIFPSTFLVSSVVLSPRFSLHRYRTSGVFGLLIYNYYHYWFYTMYLFKYIA